MTDTYDYTTLVDNAMRGVVRDVLREIQQNGLLEPHHFFVTFRTDYPGVMMSDTLRSKYPHEITIVLQHQFRELRVEQDYFKVVLSFNNVPEKLMIPFAALSGFADPAVKFGLQFHASDDEEETLPMASKTLVKSAEAPKTSLSENEETGSGAKIITLDAFRKK